MKKAWLLILILGLLISGCSKPQIRVQNDTFDDFSANNLAFFGILDFTVTVNDVVISMKGLGPGQATAYVDIEPADSVTPVLTMSFVGTNFIWSDEAVLPSTKLKKGKDYTFHYINGKDFISPPISASFKLTEDPSANNPMAPAP